MTKIRKSCFKIRAIYLTLIIGGFFICPILTFAAANSVIINEIAWMGTDDPANEWIELKNNTDQDIDLTGWTLKAVDGAPEITLSGIIAANSYFLLERTDDSSVPDIATDQIYTGALNNSGEKLGLYDKDSNLIDFVDCLLGWLAGDNTTKQTVEKTDSGWQTSLNPGGTPKAPNSSGAETPTPTDQSESDNSADFKPATNYPPIADAGPDITALAGQEIFFDGSLSSDPDWDNLAYFWNFGDGETSAEKNPSHLYNFPGQYIVSLSVEDNKFTALDIALINIYSSSIIISEFVPNQWIEIYNQSDYITNLSGWKLNDFIFPDNTLATPGQYLVLDQPDCSGDIQLFYPDGSLASQINYPPDEKEGLSVAFDGSDYYWSKTPTPGLANIISSVDLKKENNANSANPAIIKQIQPTPENPDKIILGQNNKYYVENESNQSSAVAPKNNILSEQSVNISQNALSEQKAKMILVLSIIISSSLMIAWIMLLIKKKFA